MAENDSNYVVRVATPGDYQKVLDIDENLYEGLDYIPALFHTLMHSKKDVVMVGLHDQKMVSLLVYEAHDEDRLVIGSSFRVSPSHRGKEYGVMLFNAVRNKILQDHPRTKHYLIISTIKFIEKLLPSVTSLYQWNTTVVWVHTSNLKLQPSNEPSNLQSSSAPCLLNYSTAVELLSRSNKCEDFLRRYTTQYVIGDSTLHPYKITKANLKELFSTSPVIISIVEDQPTYRQQESTSFKLLDVIQRDVFQITSLSYTSILPTKYGVLVQCYFYGDDLDTLFSHVKLCLRQLSVIWKGAVGFRLNFPLKINPEVVEDRLRHLFVKLDDNRKSGSVVASLINGFLVEMSSRL